MIIEEARYSRSASAFAPASFVDLSENRIPYLNSKWDQRVIYANENHMNQGAFFYR
jgi:hypothetical protein